VCVCVCARARLCMEGVCRGVCEDVRAFVTQRARAIGVRCGADTCGPCGQQWPQSERCVAQPHVAILMARAQLTHSERTVSVRNACNACALC